MFPELQGLVGSIGVLGGSFDPIHLGHLVAASEARHQLGLEVVVLVPAGAPPHRVAPVASGEHRYAMCALAAREDPGLRVSRLELDRAGPSYTIDTLGALREYHPVLIVGFDTLCPTVRWKDPERIVAGYQVVALARPGYVLDDVAPVFRERLAVVEVPAIGISSTEVRRRLRMGLPVTYLIPRSVEEYVRRHRLYC